MKFCNFGVNLVLYMTIDDELLWGPQEGKPDDCESVRLSLSISTNTQSRNIDIKLHLKEADSKKRKMSK